MRYRRATAAGGTYFFTVNLADRHADTLVRHIDELRTVTRSVKQAHPFDLLAMVVLPEHLHTIWRLPPGDANFALRWSLIKSGFSRQLPSSEPANASRRAKRERGIWQRRCWEHQIRDETDLERHVDYIHFNPIKHGWVRRPGDWPYSTFHRFVEHGILAPDWGGPTEDADGGAHGER